MTRHLKFLIAVHDKYNIIFTKKKYYLLILITQNNIEKVNAECWMKHYWTTDFFSYIYKKITSRIKLKLFRYLSTGLSFRALVFEFNIGRCTVSDIIKETCQAIWSILQPIEMPEPTKKKMDWNIWHIFKENKLSELSRSNWRKTY